LFKKFFDSFYERFGFEIDTNAAGRAWLRMLGVRPENAWAEVADGVFRARFGRWKISTPLDNIEEAHVAGPYRGIKAIGFRFSLSDHGMRLRPEQARALADELNAVLDRWMTEHPGDQPADGTELVFVLTGVVPLKEWPS